MCTEKAEMVRNYKKKVGGKSYKTYPSEIIDAAITDIKKGMTVSAAGRKYKIPRQTLADKVKGKHIKKPGGQSVLSAEDETLLSGVINELAGWSYPVTKLDIRKIIKDFLDKSGKIVKAFKSNMPGNDFVDSFMKRKNLSLRNAANISRSRYEVKREQVTEFFENIKGKLENAPAGNIYNFDETNVTDDPGSRKVVVSRGTKRIERVMEHSKMAISVMFCISAAGEILPPFVVYKAKNVYENWCTNGPPGTEYAATKSGWFDGDCFESWFLKIFLPFVKDRPGQKIVIGDNLASHFSAKVIQLCRENNIYFTTIPPNATHLMQPLDVAFFRPLKIYWRSILERWRRESKRSGTLPKEIFPKLLSQLYKKLDDNGKENAKSGFRKSGLHPFNPEEVLKMLPGQSNRENTGEFLNASVLKFLEEQQVPGSSIQGRRTRGRKVTPGLPVEVETVLQQDEDDNICGTCKCDYNTYRGPDWLQCVYCRKWICGFCNERSKDPRYMCEPCKDEN